MAEPVNFKYAAFPNQSVLRQKDNYKAQGESQELFWSAGLGNRLKSLFHVQ